MNMVEYRRGYFAGIARSRRGHSGVEGLGRARLVSADPEAYERGYARGLVAVVYVPGLTRADRERARRRAARLPKTCAECGVRLLEPTGVCGFCVEERMAA